jgi:hypothetical protein
MVAATTMKPRKRHVVRLAWAEESGQRLSIGQGDTPVSVFQRFTSRCATGREEPTGLTRRVALSSSLDLNWLH